MWHEFSAQIVLSSLGIVMLNLLVWLFLWGKRTGSMNTRLDNLEGNQSNPQILPECNVIFTEIKENLASLEGKMGIILLTMKENQKNNEKKRTTKRK